MSTLARNRFQVALYRRLMAFAGWVQNLPARVTPPAFRLIQIGSAFWQSRALHAAARLELAEALGDGERGVGELAETLGLHEGHLYRLMRMLAALGVFEECAPRRFRNSPASHCLRGDRPGNVRAMVLLHNSPEMSRPWGEVLEECVRDGGVPFERINGAELFDHLERTPAFDALFSRAMEAVEGVTGTLFLEDFAWEAFDRLIDVGGSVGQKALAVLAAHPGLEALVFDRPQVIASAPGYWRGRPEEALLGRVEFRAGEMLEALPAARSARDLYLLSAIFHGLDDGACRRVLANLRAAAGTQRPTLLFLDAVLPEQGVDAALAAFDMQMLIGTRGRERTRGEWERLFAGSGFAIAEVIEARTFARFIVARVAE